MTELFINSYSRTIIRSNFFYIISDYTTDNLFASLADINDSIRKYGYNFEFTKFEIMDNNCIYVYGKAKKIL